MSLRVRELLHSRSFESASGGAVGHLRSFDGAYGRAERCFLQYFAQSISSDTATRITLVFLNEPSKGFKLLLGGFSDVVFIESSEPTIDHALVECAGLY